MSMGDLVKPCNCLYCGCYTKHFFHDKPKMLGIEKEKKSGWLHRNQCLYTKYKHIFTMNTKCSKMGSVKM